ncbi:hypothetical protein COCMIDRAFT_107123 [Bipolaris oryzae ATCC 44560]|uniref:Zn(2)-C6 fungal-type domain-containing protein n=1 Tax=Bipolaris oryzae ATCC 44560 TaxID=930090 RepID=W6ZBH6_COCMI|nr:uncharacterized protein COCMIDRAFT_107123 [Bipolaris oryzae ATCC 44560]EUC41081.1 hypothetical protein COCMIDRAFT_107123 [Bipolaris oryzae ATCC 44560]
MHNKKRRARTGCLTCRARRVKCDEQVPECVRCAVANVACAGYEPQRVVVSIKPRHQSQQERQIAPSPTLSPDQNSQRQDAARPPFPNLPSKLQSVTQGPVVAVPSNHSPLVAFPSGPHPDQSPSPGARHVLGYHQVLIRTIPMLFPSQHLHFWHDKLFQKAWGCNYLYLTLVSLGISHRAALMTAATSDCDKANGLDMKITAVQLYTQALEELAKHLEEAKQKPSLLVATLCLMAYFESFSGNIPAFTGRVQAANYYFTTLLPVREAPGCDETSQDNDLPPLRDCLRSLGQTCYVTLPLNMIDVTTGLHLNNYRSRGTGPEHTSPTSLVALESLVDMVSESCEIKEIVWSPLAAYARSVSARTLNDFEQNLICWRNNHLELIPELDTDSALRALLIYGWSQFAMPPVPYTAITRNKSLAAAHYNFYRARIKWALVLLGDDVLRNKPIAEFYFYEALRHAASHAAFLVAAENDQNIYIPCEALKVGLLPVLHIIGLCSPEPLWLRWIKDLSDQIVQEGVLKGHTFATSLDCLHRFEMYRFGHDYSTTVDQYPEPAERIICQLIPETDGRHFTSFFAVPSAANSPRRAGLGAYRVIGNARWRCGYGEGPCTPVITMYGSDHMKLEPLSTEWLYSMQPVFEWLSWSREKEFRMERALQDHISGTRLLLAADGAITNGQDDT